MRRCSIEQSSSSWLPPLLAPLRQHASDHRTSHVVVVSSTRPTDRHRPTQSHQLLSQLALFVLSFQCERMKQPHSLTLHGTSQLTILATPKLTLTLQVYGGKCVGGKQSRIRVVLLCSRKKLARKQRMAEERGRDTEEICLSTA